MQLKILAIAAFVALIAFGPARSCLYGQVERKEFINGLSDQQFRNQAIGWYKAGRNRRLTVLPKKKTLVAVFDWGNGVANERRRDICQRRRQTGIFATCWN